MQYKLVKFLSMDKAVLENKNNYYLASFADVPPRHLGQGVPRPCTEVLVFSADKNGAVADWGEVDGGRGYKSLADFILEKCTVL